MTTLSLENNYNDKDYKELFKQLDTNELPSTTIDKALAKVSTENNDNSNSPNTSNSSKTKRKGKGKYKTRSNL
jgi:hypothetical protein